jgi:hypothetical protein
MRIGTWNVDYAKTADLPDLHARLIEHPADIWILTETHDELRPFGTTYCQSSGQRDLSEAPGLVRPGSQWVTIWSRFPIMPMDGLDVSDSHRTIVARIDLSDLKKGAEAIIFGTVLPERGEAEHASAITQQAMEWTLLRATYPDALFCVAGDFNTDMGRASDYGLKHFFGPRGSTGLLAASLRAVGLHTVTDTGFPEGLKLKYPPIDHIALSSAQAGKARIASIWSGVNGHGDDVGDRIGVVIDVAWPTSS